MSKISGTSSSAGAASGMRKQKREKEREREFTCVLTRSRFPARVDQADEPGGEKVHKMERSRKAAFRDTPRKEDNKRSGAIAIERKREREGEREKERLPNPACRSIFSKEKKKL